MVLPQSDAKPTTSIRAVCSVLASLSKGAHVATLPRHGLETTTLKLTNPIDALSLSLKPAAESAKAFDVRAWLEGSVLENPRR